MGKYEYKTEKVGFGNNLFASLDEQAAITSITNAATKNAVEGWELVTYSFVTKVGHGSGIYMTYKRKIN